MADGAGWSCGGYGGFQEGDWQHGCCCCCCFWGECCKEWKEHCGENSGRDCRQNVAAAAIVDGYCGRRIHYSTVVGGVVGFVRGRRGCRR